MKAIDIDRPKQWSPAWHYVRMLELGMRTLSELEQYCPVDQSDKDAVTAAIDYMKQQKTKKDPRGGRRAGSGRKPIDTPRRMVSVRLSEETIAYLATTDSKTDAIESALQNTKAFRAWKKMLPKL